MFGNGASVAVSGGVNNGSTYAGDRVVRSLPWLFRVFVPGMVGGWPR